MVSLDMLSKGQSGLIDHFDTDELPLKLIEMGCLPGSTISLIQKAPFNDPLYIKIDDSFLAIRKETAKHIFVQLK
ncbi:MAG: ferrous iron transport protein A [Flavobacteriaceae bacterium]|nr:ferrous iron transport protein A [Flavobacteriaceae bacterium]|tara:strand:+ start:85 stop:309 length:225 start_codon:yes stop_codon:yes gene_type:complete